MSAASCSICRDPARRALIDGELKVGTRPADIFRKFAPTMGFSQSALYRHARGHQRRTSTGARWVDGESTLGDLISDLGRLRRGLLATFAEATAQGNDASANRAAHEAHSIAATLLKTGIEDDAVAEDLAVLDRLRAAMHRATLTRPDFAHELAEAARDVRDEGLATDLDDLAMSAVNYLTTKNSN